MHVTLSLNDSQDLFTRGCQKERCDDPLSRDSRVVRAWSSLGLSTVWVDSGLLKGPK